MPTDWIFYAFAVPAVILVGLAKGGLSGVGALGMPLFALAVPPLEAAAILLPILIVQDVVSVWAFRHTWDGWIIKVMAPGMLLGIGLGYIFAASVSADAVLAVVALISMLFAGHRLWVERGAREVAASTSPGWVGSLFGVATGFTSQIAHAGGPPYQMWVMPRRLDRDVFIGTGAILFAGMNWVKVPAYAALGQFTRPHLLATAALLPIAIVSTFAGVWLVRRITGEIFYRIAYWLMLVIGAKLLWDALG